MTKEEWIDLARANGKMCLPPDVFELLFPPGLPDQRAMQQALDFATANGMTISFEGEEVCIASKK